MNSISTQRWLTRAVMPMAFLLTLAGNALAQCDITWPGNPNPISITIVIDPITGNAILNKNVTNANGITSGICGPIDTDDHIRFYTSAAKNTFFQPANPWAANFNCANVGTTYTIWVALNDGTNGMVMINPPGESDAVPVVITLVDQTPPMAGAFPANVTVNSSQDGSGDCTLTNLFSNTLEDIAIFGIPAAPAGPNEFYDNCLGALSVTYQLSGATVLAEGPAPFLFPYVWDAGLATFNVGTTLVTYRVYDNLVVLGPGNPLVITVSVTVVDDETPSITCPPNQNVSTDAGICTRTISNLAAASYSDNCAVTAVTWSAPGATPAASPGTGINTLNATFPVGTTSVEFTAEDAGGLTSTCVFDVVVTDNELPTIFCPGDLTVSASIPPACTYTAGTELDYLTANDNCGVSTVINNINGLNSLDAVPLTLGVTNIVWTAEDAQGNTQSCAFNLTVEDDVAPVGPIAGNTITVNVTPGDCSATVSYEYPGLFFYNPDECTPPVSLTEGPATVNGVVDPSFLLPLIPFDPFSGRMNFIFGAGATLSFPIGQTIIPYTWTDGVGNETVEYIIVNVIENIPPMAKCKPGILTLPLNALGQATLTVDMVNNGSSDNCGLESLTISDTDFDCSDLIGTHIVTLTAEDFAGNTATCTATIDVVDNIVPQVLCPGSKTVTTNLGCQADNISNIGMSLGVSPLLPGQYLDNCPGATVAWQLTGVTIASGVGSVPGGQAFNTGVTTVTYTITDAAGNNAVCNFSINVTDNTPPDWTGTGQAAGSTITQNANMGGCMAQVTWTEPTFTDACTPPVIVSKTHNPGTSFNFGTTTVTYTAVDGAGNVRVHTFNVVVVDTQAPNAQCKNINVFLNNAGTVTVTAAQVDNLSTDNCFFNYTSPSATYNCNHIGPNNYTLQITDGSGNTATCVAVVTVADTIKPVALCTTIPVINLSAAGTFTLAASTVNNGSTDNTFPLCDLTYDIAVGSSTFGPSFNFDCSDLGFRTLTLRVTDKAGNTSICSQIVEVKDVTAPTFTAPANVTINCDAPSDPTNTGTFSNLDDNCDPAPVVTLLPDMTVSVVCPNSYTLIRTWQATDASGNASTTSHTIVVQDTQAPTFNIQNTISLQTVSPTSCSAPLTLQLTQDSISDNCTTVFGNFTIQYTIDYPTPSYGFVDVNTFTAGNIIPGGGFPVGNTLVTWRVTDECGRSATATVLISVTDVHAPAFSVAYSAANCGKAYVLPNTTGACSNLFAWPRPNASTMDITDCLNFTVTEQISNSTVSAFLNLTNPFNYNTMSPFAVFPTAQFPVGITTIAYIATDAAGNTSTCSFTIEIQDTQAPVLTCPPNQILLATCPSAQVPNYTTQVGVTDNCSGNVQLTQVVPAGTTLGSIFAPNLPATGNQFMITVTGNDGYNSSTCTFTVTLQDGQAPIPVLTTLPDLIDSCGTLIVFAPKALDPCNPAADTIYGTPSTPVGSFLNTNPPSYQLNPGSYVITWNYNDGNGNISTQPQNITVLNDVFPPVAICVANLTVDLDPITGLAGILPTQLNNGSFDPNQCGPLSFSVTPDTVDCSNAGPSATAVTLTVFDLKGNPATCITNVTVRDVTSPILSGAPANLTVEACDSIPAAIQITASDACAGTSLVSATQTSTQTPAGGIGKYNYVITRTWTTSDPSGNTAVVTRTVTVQDTEAPVFTNAPTMVMVTTDPDRLTCDDTVSVNILPFVSDCATGTDLTVTNNKEPADGGNLSAIFTVGTHVVTFTATDVSGNVQTHTVTVVVKDGTPPTAVCINGVSAALQPSGTVVVTTAQFNNNSYDNCASNLDLKIQRLDKLPLQTPSNTLLYDCNDADGVTHHPVKLFVTDGAGNMSMCETFIVIQDNVDPTVTLCPTDKVVVCTDTLSTQDHGTALFTDNCPANLTVSFDDVIADDTTGNACYLIERTWMAVDLAGNTSTCLQTFSVLDTVAPILSQYPPNVTITCSQNLVPPINVTATDNCTAFVGVTFVQDTIDVSPGLCSKYSYTIQRTRTAVDECGNVESHTNTITVVDNASPSFPGLPDTIVVQSVNFPPNAGCNVPVSLNVAQFLVDCADLSEITVTNNAPQGNGGLSASGDYQVGTYKVIFEATDPCGNVGKDSVVVIVIDNSKPTVICNNNVVISLGSNGSAMLQPQDIDLGSIDNCGIDTMFLDKSLFTCAELGINPVTLTVVDLYGNDNTCTVNVNVTLGNGVGFDLAVTGTPETYFGADNGTAIATATAGSGTFGFVWSNSETTDTITNLNPGVYYVTVTDLGSGCVRVDSFVVLAGAKLTITAGTASGMQTETVQVPVTVDNFFAMIGMSFSMHVTNPIVGTIVGGTPTGALPGALALNVVGNDLTVFWVGNGTPLDLPNGTVIFNLDVQLGTAPVGSTSPVTIDGTPTALSFQQDSSGILVSAMASLVSGMVMIDSLAANDIEIAGIIKTWSGAGTPVPGVNVAMTGTVPQSTVTGVPGTYSFLVPPGSNTTVTPSKSVTSNFSGGINVGDLLAIQNHAASVNLLTNPYQFVAGDVNGNNLIDLVDYLLVQQLILGTVQHYSNGAPDWKFIPSSYMFPTPNPLSAPYPQSISHTPANMDFLNDDFTAVRIGDVTGNAPVNNISNNTQDRSGDVFRFRLNEQAVRAGELVLVPFMAKDFADRQAYQMTIAFDPNALELLDIEPGVLPNFGLGNFGTAHLDNGLLTNLWVSSNPLTLNDGEVLFTLVFRAQEHRAALSNILRPTSQVTAAEALDAAGNTIAVAFDFAQTTSSLNPAAETFALYQNQPNPFREQTTINFRLPQAGRAVLRVFSMDGRLVKTIVGNFAEGFNTVMLQKSDIGSPGVYWYKLDTDTNSDRKKMILID